MCTSHTNSKTEANILEQDDDVSEVSDILYPFGAAFLMRRTKMIRIMHNLIAYIPIHTPKKVHYTHIVVDE